MEKALVQPTSWEDIFNSEAVKEMPGRERGANLMSLVGSIFLKWPAKLLPSSIAGGSRGYLQLWTERMS